MNLYVSVVMLTFKSVQNMFKILMFTDATLFTLIDLSYIEKNSYVSYSRYLYFQSIEFFRYSYLYLRFRDKTFYYLKNYNSFMIYARSLNYV
jgi:hypothetical protein